MKHVCLALNWAFGIIFLLLGLHLSREFLTGGSLLVLISLLMLPPVRKLAYSITGKQLSPRVRGAVILLLLVASSVAVIGSKIREDLELSAMEARERIQKGYARSQKRHMDFFWVESWSHSDYVKRHGAALCAFCHGLDAGDASLFGPRCMICHRDIPAFERSLQPRPAEPVKDKERLGLSN